MNRTHITLFGLLLTACSAPPPASPTEVLPEGLIQLHLDDTVTSQGLSDLRSFILTGKPGQTTTVGVVLDAPGSTAYSLSAPPWLSLTPTSGPLKKGLASLKATFTCPAQPQNILGTVTVNATNITQRALIPAVLVCKTSAAPSTYLYPPVTDVTPGSTVTSQAVRLTGLSSVTPLTVLGGTPIVNGVPVPATGSTVRKGDYLALRVQASALGKTTVAAVANAGTFNGLFLVSTRTITVPSTLSASPDRLDFLDALPGSAQALTVTRSADLGVPTLTTTCAGIATVTAGSSTSTTSSYTVRPDGPGSCGLTFASGVVQASVPITVTTTSVTPY